MPEFGVLEGAVLRCRDCRGRIVVGTQIWQSWADPRIVVCCVCRTFDELVWAFS